MGPGCQAKDLDLILEGAERSERREGMEHPSHTQLLPSFPSPTRRARRGPGRQAIRGSWYNSAEQAWSRRLT